MPLSSTSLITSAAMGDALTAAQLKTVFLDSYGRAYAVDLAKNGTRAATSLKLAGALSNRMRQIATGTDRLSLAFSVAFHGQVTALSSSRELRLWQGDAATAQVLAARVIARLSPSTSFGYAHAQGTDGLSAQLRGQDQPAFLIAGDPLDDVGFRRSNQNAFALRRQVGRWGLTLTAENGRAEPDANAFSGLGEQRSRDGVATRYGLALDRKFNKLETSLAVSWLSENQTILGAQLHDALASTGAGSIFLDAGLAWRPADEWRLGATWRQGYTHARVGGLVAQGSMLVSNAWAIDAMRYGVFSATDTVSFRISQPLRVANGGLNFVLPIAYDYATSSAAQGLSRLSLAPRGREIAAELGWRGNLAHGWGGATLFYRREPSHVAGAPGGWGRGI